MANQQLIDGASQRIRTGLELAPELFAQIAGALFGVFSGFKLLLGAFIVDVKSLTSPAGRRQIFYGRQGPKPVTFEGLFPDKQCVKVFDDEVRLLRYVAAHACPKARLKSRTDIRRQCFRERRSKTVAL